VAEFESPTDLSFNRGLIEDPEAVAREAGAASWLYLCGEEFASMEGDVVCRRRGGGSGVGQRRVRPAASMDLDLARRQVAALDRLPRPTLVTCRVGPRSSALVYLFAGLKSGATADGVLARARADGAPFSGSDELEAWVAQGLRELSDTQG
jgi:hypothetical protein